MRSMEPGAGSAGFTLIELLVVLAVFGLLSVMLFGGLRFATRTISVATGRLDRAEELSLAAGFLRNQLADIRPFPAAGRSTVAFAGEPGSISFVSAPPAYLAPGGFHALRIAQEGDGARRRLVLRWQTMPGETLPETPGLRPSVLLDDIAQAAFAYFGAASSRQAPEWQESWDGSQGLPSLIRLRVTFLDGAAAPDLVIAVRPAQEGSR